MIKLPFLNLRKNKNQSENFLAIYPEPFKVQVAYFEAANPPTDEVPQAQLISAVSKFMPEDSLFHAGDHFNQTLETTEAILDEMAQEYPDLPTQVIFGLSSDHCIDLMSIARLENQTKKRFTQEQVEELATQAQKNASFRAQDILATQKGDTDTDLELITSVDIFKKIDGAVTRDPIGLEGKELEFSWFGSFAEAPYLRYLQNLAKKLGLDILTVSSLSYSFYSSLQELDSNYRNCVVINLGTSLTEVSVAFGGGLVGSRFINMGLISILKQISAKLELHYEETERVLEKYREGTLDSSIAVEVQKIVRRFFVVWSQALNMVFSDFTGIKTFSSRVLLVGPGFDIPDLVELTSVEPWFKSIPFKAPPEFEKALASGKLTEVTDISGKSSKLSWTLPLSLAHVYFKLEEDA
ncbi:hypothetical protein GF360_01700 [candidate division WWE3 bacterium]|nr:hypothetical protein [candidate division WWE3 bacterium]